MVDGVRPKHKMVHIFRGVIVDVGRETDRVVLPCVAIGIVRSYNIARWEENNRDYGELALECRRWSLEHKCLCLRH